MKNFILLAGLIVGMLPGLVSAATINLFNTGTGLSDNDIDPNYTIFSGSNSSPAIVATSAGGFPVGPWTADSATSAWISPTEDTNGPTGNYIYRTAFDLTGLDPASAQISGGWSTDNAGVDIQINGISLGFTTPTNSFQTAFDAFSITNGFISGINTLDFVVNNGGGPTGLRVEMAGTAETSAVPVPAAIWLLGSGLIGLISLKRKKTA